MVSLEAGCQNQKQQFMTSLDQIGELKSEIQNQIYSIKSHLRNVEDNAQHQRDNISRIFNDMRYKIIQRE